MTQVKLNYEIEYLFNSEGKNMQNNLISISKENNKPRMLGYSS